MTNEKCGGWSTGQEESKWSTEHKLVKSCEVTTKEELCLQIHADVLRKIRAINGKMAKLEWFGYLIGSGDGKAFLATDLLIPKQEVSSGKVDIKEPSIDPRIIGTVHSHHGMGAFTSGSDEDTLVSNHPVTIVVSDKEWLGKIRVTLPCGHFIAYEVPVEVFYPTAVNLDDFVVSVMPNISEVTITTTAVTSGSTQGKICPDCKKFVSWGQTTWVKSRNTLLCPDCATKAINEKAQEQHNHGAYAPCSMCHKYQDPDNMLEIQGKPVCYDCLTGDVG